MSGCSPSVTGWAFVGDVFTVVLDESGKLQGFCVSHQNLKMRCVAAVGLSSPKEAACVALCVCLSVCVSVCLV